MTDEPSRDRGIVPHHHLHVRSHLDDSSRRIEKHKQKEYPCQQKLHARIAAAQCWYSDRSESAKYAATINQQKRRHSTRSNATLNSERKRKKEMEGKAVYKAISAVQADLAKEGLAKDRKNQQQGFMFRGIDDVYGVLSPVLAKHGLCILPRVIARICEERQAKSGGALYNVSVEAEYDLVASEDGSMHTVRSVGEAMDSADKATNKAMSAAYKYMAFQTFCIPVEGENHDADAETPEQTIPRRQTAESRSQSNGSRGPADPIGPASEPQTKKIFAMMTNLGTPKDRMRAEIEAIIDRPVESSRDLTKAEASAVIKVLEQREKAAGKPYDQNDNLPF